MVAFGEAPRVTKIAAALRRLEFSADIRESVGMPHNYPGKAQDERDVQAFCRVFGELPPFNLLAALRWYLRFR